MTTAADKRLLAPPDGKPVDHGGMPVTTEPLEGGVRIENLSVGPGHEARALYRELSPAEKKDRQQAETRAVGFRRADAAVFLRLTRDALLRATDHVDLPGATERVQDAKAWQKWRQALRDLPAAVSDPEDVTWPKPPAATSALLEHRRLWPALDWTPLETTSGPKAKRRARAR